MSEPFTVTITVNDNVAPMWDNAPGSLDETHVCSSEDNGPTPPTATDNCPDNMATVTIESDVTTPDDQVCDDQYVRIITYRATDECGNMSEPFTVTITVHDDVAPDIECLANLELNCQSEIPDPDPDSVITEDNCEGVVSVIYVGDIDNGGAGCIGDTLVVERTYRATDECGNSSECIQIIQIVDDVDPILTCPPDITINCSESIEPINTGLPSYSDNCGILDLEYVDDVQFVDCEQTGIVTRRWVVFDLCGNTDTCFQEILVEGEIASVSNFVWMDSNGNGLQDEGELGVQNVLVRLFDENNNLILTRITDWDGHYFIDIDQPGDYYLKFVPPGNLKFTFSDVGADDELDSDVTQFISEGTTDIFYNRIGRSFDEYGCGLI